MPYGHTCPSDIDVGAPMMGSGNLEPDMMGGYLSPIQPHGALIPIYLLPKVLLV